MIRGRMILLALMMWLPGTSVLGHALEPGFLDLRQITTSSWQVFWRKPEVAGNPMAIEATLPEGCSPQVGPAPNFDGVAWMAAWVVDCPNGMLGGAVMISGLETQRTDVLLRIQAQEKNAETVRLTPDQTRYVIPATPSTLTVFSSYAALGFDHILEGWDHLLFVFALLLLIRDFWRLVGAVTAFTVAHSITLALASLGHITVPGPPVEAVIALSIIFMAVEILKGNGATDRLSERAPWLISFSFGLLHGLGFAGALSDIGLPEQDVVTALFAFNVGVEAGQLAFVGTILLAMKLGMWLLPRMVAQKISAQRGLANLALGYAVGGVSTYWFVERVMSF